MNSFDAGKYAFYIVVVKAVISPLIALLIGWLIPSPIKPKIEKKEEG